MARICIIEDHQLVRDAVANMLTRAGHTLVGTSGSYDEALALIENSLPDIVIVDLNLGSGDMGLTLTQSLRAAFPDVKVIVYSMRTNLHTVAAAYRAGALGYVTKSADPELLVTAVTAVESGSMYFLPGMGERLTELQIRGTAQDPTQVLSSKELEIFKLLAKGLTNEDTAERLGLTAKSIANRVLAIKQKLNCSRSDFTNIALRYGLIDLHL